MALQLVQQEVIGLNQEALEEWVAYRAEDLKKPMTPRAISMLKKKLMQWDEEEQMRIVEECILNNWRGVYYVEPPKTKPTLQGDTEWLTMTENKSMTSSMR